MIAARALARSLSRRHRTATVLMVLLLGLSSGVVGAAVAGARRAEGSLARYDASARAFDLAVFSCPPGVDPTAFESQVHFAEACFGRDQTRDAVETLRGIAGVDEVSIDSFAVGGVLDPEATSGWGYVAGLAITDSTRGSSHGDPRLIAGRFPDPHAADEVLISEVTAAQGRLALGDRFRLASWSTDELDLGVSGALEPTTDAVELEVVGVGRFRDDLAPPGADDVSDLFVDGDLLVSGAAAETVAGFATYGQGAAVRLDRGQAGIEEFQRRLGEVWDDRAFFAQSTAPDAGAADSVATVIAVEKSATLGVAAVAVIAVVAFGMLTLLRQQRAELGDHGALQAMGMTSGDLRAASGFRSARIVGPAVAVGLGTMVALSPATPFGVARRAEPDVGVFVDAWVALGLVVGVSVLVFGAALAPARRESRALARPQRSPRATRSMAASLGPVIRSGIEMARGSWPRVAAGVAALAAAAMVAAIVTVASLERVVDQPIRYGAWWDLSAGDYSDPDALADGAAAVVADPDVASVAGLFDQADSITLDGQAVTLKGYVPFKGDPGPVLAEGRAPIRDDEVALGAVTIRRLGLDIGDTAAMVAPDSGTAVDLTVTGIFVNANPIVLNESAGLGAFLTTSLVEEVTPGVAQELLIDFRPGVDVDAAIARLARTYRGRMVPVQPGDDIRNLDRLSVAPWALAGLIATLAGATLVHALVTTVRRRRHDLAVLAVLGLVRGQVRQVMAWATAVTMARAVVIGVPLGLVVGPKLWEILQDRVSVPSGAVRPVGMIVVVAVVSMVAGHTITTVATRSQLRLRLGTLLRGD